MPTAVAGAFAISNSPIPEGVGESDGSPLRSAPDRREGSVLIRGRFYDIHGFGKTWFALFTDPWSVFMKYRRKPSAFSLAKMVTYIRSKNSITGNHLRQAFEPW